VLVPPQSRKFVSNTREAGLVDFNDYTIDGNSRFWAGGFILYDFGPPEIPDREYYLFGNVYLPRRAAQGRQTQNEPQTISRNHCTSR
jgi:hypothetical protein